MSAIQRAWEGVFKAMRKASTVERVERLARSGRWEELERLLMDQGRPVDATPGRFRALASAVSEAPMPVIEALIQVGASPFERSIRRSKGFVSYSESLLEIAAVRQDWAAWCRMANRASRPVEGESVRKASQERCFLSQAASHFGFSDKGVLADEGKGLVDERLMLWLEGAQALIIAGADSTARAPHKAMEVFQSPLLCLAGGHGLPRSTSALIEAGASVSTRCDKGMLAEHWACRALSFRAFADRPGAMAVYSGVNGVLERLWDAGSDPTAADDGGRTPRDWLLKTKLAERAYDEARARWESRALTLAASSKGLKATRGARL